MPLSHITVLDLSRVRAGPTAVRQLADWGAKVVKIEPPEDIDGSKGMGGDRHSPDFQNTQRNKRSITINLKSEEGLGVFRRLVGQADVVVENYRPDVKDRLGISYEALALLNPGIVLASISAFGQDGPYAARPGFDQIVQGLGGLMSITGLPGQGPVRAGIPIADLSAGLFCAIGILVALVEREKSGIGQWVHTSLLEAQISMLDFQAARWTVARDCPKQAGNDHPTSIPTGVFMARDRPINIAGGGEAMWRRICDALGLSEALVNPDFASEEGRSRHRARINELIQARVGTEDANTWIARMNAAGVPCGLIYRIDEMFDDPQVRHLEMRMPVRHPALGSIDLVRHPLNFSRSARHPSVPTPERGEQTASILREFGFDETEIAALRQSQAI